MNKNTYYPASVCFEESLKWNSEGGEIFVPGDTDKYLTVGVLGKKYQNKGPENYRPSPVVMCSALIPCEELMQQPKELKNLVAKVEGKEHAVQILV